MPAGNEADKERVLKAKTMIEIVEEALDLQDRLNDSDDNVVRAAEQDLKKLIDRFYHENRDMMVPQQYEAARKDFKYFMKLLTLSLKHYEPEPDPLEKHITN